MGFTEITFLFIFLPASILLYLLTDRLFKNVKISNAVLSALSLAFCFWTDKDSLIFLAALIIFVYLAGLVLKKYGGPAPGHKRAAAAVPVIILTAVLLFFKYTSVISSWINKAAGRGIIRAADIIVPAGVSFIIFGSISYLIDIYRGDAPAGTLLECCTFISMFPKLISGPIVLWKDMRSQLSERKSTAEQTAYGIDRIIVGLAKKAILADTFGTQITSINSGMAGSGADVPTMWLRALLYFFQLYLDFSGYSDIAVGLCSIFGFKVKENFDHPYLSCSVTEFWRRWHISLGTWFREYVYIPLGGNRRGSVGLHLMIVFLLTGIWHGNGLQFLIWGAAHGILVAAERKIRDHEWYKKIPKAVKWVLTTLFVLLAWVLFMSKDLQSAVQTYSGMFIPMSPGGVGLSWRHYLTNRTLLFLVIAAASEIIAASGLRNKLSRLFDTNAGTIVKRVLLIILFVIDILYIVNSTYSPFIYFRF